MPSQRLEDLVERPEGAARPDGVARPDGLARTSADEATPVAPFNVLIVCTGNICRSPIAEAVLSDRLERAIRSSWPDAGSMAWEESRPISVRSAGTATNQELERPAEVIDQLRRLGAPISPHAVTPLTPEVLSDVDLLITMTRDQRRSAVKLAPRLVTKAFTLVEYARILDSMTALPVDATTPRLTTSDVATFLRETSIRAGRRRGMVPPPASPSVFDIQDPYRMSADVYRSVSDAIAGAIDDIVGALTTLAKR